VWAFRSPGSTAQDRSSEPLGWFTEQPLSFNHFCTIKISVAMIATVIAFKELIISAPNMQAFMAGLTGVSRGDSNYFYPCSNPLVF